MPAGSIGSGISRPLHVRLWSHKYRQRGGSLNAGSRWLVGGRGRCDCWAVLSLELGLLRGPRPERTDTRARRGSRSTLRRVPALRDVAASPTPQTDRSDEKEEAEAARRGLIRQHSPPIPAARSSSCARLECCRRSRTRLSQTGGSLPAAAPVATSTAHSATRTTPTYSGASGSPPPGTNWRRGPNH